MFTKTHVLPLKRFNYKIYSYHVRMIKKFWFGPVCDSDVCNLRLFRCLQLFPFFHRDKYQCPGKTSLPKIDETQNVDVKCHVFSE